MKIKITKFGDAAGILGKKLTLDEEGQVRKEAVVSFAQGYFESVESDWDQFGSVIKSLKPSEALGMGVCCKRFNGDPAPISKGRIVTTKNELFAGPGACARTLANFKWHEPPCPHHNVVMFDVDEAITSIDEARERLFTAFPELARIPSGYWVMPSTSAMIYNTVTGKQVSGLTGVHFYFALPNTVDIAKLKLYLKVHTWLSEVGYFKVSQHKFGANLLERGYLDLSVFSPERLDFIGDCQCGEGLRQDRGEPLWYPTENTEDLGELDFSVTVDEEQLAQHLKTEARYALEGTLPPPAVDPDSAKFAEFVNAGVLPGSFQLNFDSKGATYVWEVIADPTRFHAQTMSDPLFPEKGRNKAKYYFNSDGDKHTSHVVNSFVKGGRHFFLQLDLPGALEMIQRMDMDTLKTLFGTAGGRGWDEMAHLETDAELSAVMEALKARGVGKIKELKAYMGKAVATDVQVAKLSVFEHLNERFAYVDVGAKPRILEDTGTETLLRTRQDFLTCVENIHVKVWKGGKFQKVSAGEAWLKWEGRRTYQGFEFNPQIHAREFERGGLKIYNRFRGWAVQPTEARQCGRAHCNGQGCFEWFFGDGKHKVCPLGSWTYWLRTIYEAVCNKDAHATRWVVDWLSHMVQCPCTGDAKPSTALVIRGGQGTGKGSVIWPLMKIFGRYASHCDSMTDITSNFNSFFEECILLFADEATWGGSKSESGKLKRMISEATLTIEPKGVDKYQALNWLRAYIASNADWVVPAEGDERRYTIFDILDCFKQNHEWFAKVKGGSLSELLDEMLKWKITTDIWHNLDTEALQQQKEQGWNVVEEFLYEAVTTSMFWDPKTGASQVIPHSVIEETFLARFTRHWTAAGMTPPVFVRRVRKHLKDKFNFDIGGSGVKVLSGNKWVYGFPAPDRQELATKLGIKLEDE